MVRRCPFRCGSPKKEIACPAAYNWAPRWVVARDYVTRERGDIMTNGFHKPAVQAKKKADKRKAAKVKDTSLSRRLLTKGLRSANA